VIDYLVNVGFWTILGTMLLVQFGAIGLFYMIGTYNMRRYK
jgi:hypothetical protein